MINAFSFHLVHVKKLHAHTRLDNPQRKFFSVCCNEKSNGSSSSSSSFMKASVGEEGKKLWYNHLLYFFLTLEMCKKFMQLGLVCVCAKWCWCWIENASTTIVPSFRHDSWRVRARKSEFCVCMNVHTCWCQFLNITHNLHGNSKKMHFSSLTLFFSYINLNSLFCKRPPYTLLKKKERENVYNLRQ